MKFPITNNVEAAMAIAQCDGWMAVAVDYTIVFPVVLQRAPIVRKDIVLASQWCYEALLGDIASGMVVLDDIRRLSRDHNYDIDVRYDFACNVAAGVPWRSVRGQEAR